MRLAFVYGRWSSQIHGQFDIKRIYKDKGLTGSESFFFNTVKGLAERGHQIDAFCDCIEEVPKSDSLSGAFVYGLKNDVGKDYDAYVSWNEPDRLENLPKDKLRICVQQLNDFSYCKGNFDEFADYYVSPSRVHADYLLSCCPHIKHQKMRVLPNSINLEFYDNAEISERDTNTIIYCSSPDRGLHWILDWFPVIKKRVPEAKLKIYYKYQQWYDGTKEMWYDEGLKNWYHIGFRARYINECLDRLGRKGENSVYLLGNVNNVEMAKELMSAGVLAYPCDTVRFTEGFSVSIMDACASGVAPIISDVDAIGSVYQGVAHVIPGRPEPNREVWIDTIVRALTDKVFREDIVKRSMAFARKNTRQIRSIQWEKLLLSLMLEKQATLEK